MNSSMEMRSRFIKFETTDSELRPSMLPQLSIKFNFSFIHKASILVHNQDSSSEYSHVHSAFVPVRRALSHDNVRDAIGKVIKGRLRAAEISCLIEIVREAVRREVPADKPLPRYKNLILDFDVVVVESQHLVGKDGDHGVVSAAELPCGEGQECSVCLDKFGGGRGAFKLPCLHVFHGGCIQEWLRNHRSCPLCRYEIPRSEHHLVQQLLNFVS